MQLIHGGGQINEPRAYHDVCVYIFTPVLVASFSLSLARSQRLWRGRQSAIHIVLNGGELYTFSVQKNKAVSVLSAARAADYCSSGASASWTHRARAIKKSSEFVCGDAAKRAAPCAPREFRDGQLFCLLPTSWSRLLNFSLASDLPLLLHILRLWSGSVYGK